LICVFWLLLWYLQTFGHCVLCTSLICVFWLLLWHLQTLTIVLSVFHWFVSKGVIRRHKSMKDREHNGQNLKIPKG
jgi:hypothetical protein